MTWLQLNKIDQRINEIEKIIDDYPDLDDDILQNLDHELHLLMLKLTERIDELDTTNEFRKGFTIVS